MQVRIRTPSPKSPNPSLTNHSLVGLLLHPQPHPPYRRTSSNPLNTKWSTPVVLPCHHWLRAGRGRQTLPLLARTVLPQFASKPEVLLRREALKYCQQVYMLSNR